MRIKNLPHPIPYQGSKRNLALDILRYFPGTVAVLYEPFAGSAAITIAAAAEGLAQGYFLNDLNKPLVDLWEQIINHPEELTAKYRTLWNNQLHDPKAYYIDVRDQFNKTGAPHLFLYLLARCVKASVRYNSRGEFNQSADNRRKGMKPETMKMQVMGASYFLKNKPKDYMLLSGSANRAKSWSCEHCANWLDLKDTSICRKCYWAYPDSYEHVAMRQARRADILWSGSEITVYDRLKQRTLELQKDLPACIKELIAKHLEE